MNHASGQSAPEIAAFLGSAEAKLARAGEPGPAARLAGLSDRYPDHALLACYHADALQSAGRRAAAASAYRQALRLDNRLFDAWYGLAAACLSLDAYGDAVTAARRALALRPDAAAALCNLGEALFNLGEVDAAVAAYRQAVAIGDAAVRANATAAIALVIPGSPAADNEAVLAARRAWLRPFGLPLPRPARRDSNGKLRVGYLSAHFGARNWMKPVWPVINRHDRAAMEIHLISDGADPTPESGYLDHAEDRVWRARGLSNERLAHHLAAAGLDVLVDLNGYSAQARLPLLLHRPVPLILGWFNMFATTGTDAFDAIIGDAAVLPAAEEPCYAERVLRVPGSYLAFRVGYPVPDVAPPPSLDAGAITLGCLCSGYKLTDTVLAAWARILAAAPAARLFLRNATLDEASNLAALRERLHAAGIDLGRVTLGGGGEHQDFLGAYRHVDIALDTFPYNGGTTTTEALWQGVPVLTFDGDRWASRTSKSLLQAAGLRDWVATDVDAYVARAVDLALDPGTPGRLTTLRAGLRAQLAASAACDTEALRLALERIYRGTA